MSTLAGIASSAEKIGIDYLNLLVTQLRNQNPLDPMSNTEMTSQLAQIGQLERLENIDSTFKQALQSAQVNYGAELIGKEITFISGDAETVSGLVEGVEVSDGKVLLRVGTERVELDEILAVS